MTKGALFSEGAAMLWMLVVCAALSTACLMAAIALGKWDDSQSSGVT